jgi:hypothetical protein
VIDRSVGTGLVSAVGAAEIILFRLDAVSDDLAAAMGTDRSEFVDRAFETIENVPVSRRDHLERKVIIVSANLALCHFEQPPISSLPGSL